MDDFTGKIFDDESSTPSRTKAGATFLRRGRSDSARHELDHCVRLYEFHVGAYIKGIAFFLAINAVLMKFALDDKSRQLIYASVALLSCIAILLPLRFGFRHETKLAEEFRRLARQARTQPIDTSPLAMLVRVTLAFWLVIFSVWIYIFYSALGALSVPFAE